MINYMICHIVKYHVQLSRLSFNRDDVVFENFLLYMVRHGPLNVQYIDLHIYDVLYFDWN